ncbi:RNA-directed DNA polymerase, eukaryota [Tanacetum coccineum]
MNKKQSTTAKQEDESSVVPDNLEAVEPKDGEEYTNLKVAEENQSLDPFGIYKLLNKRRNDNNEASNKESLQFPPGFTPREEGECDDSVHEFNESVEMDIPKSGGSILTLMDELIKVGQTMGFKMDGCLNPKAKKDWVKELCVSNMVNFLTLQETKMESIDLFDIKRCWGNFAFDFVYSESRGNSGGILCVWNPNVFNKSSITVLDYFIMTRGVWFSNGEVIVMGDFNEVRNKNERFGSNFIVQGAKAFNSFIVNSNLEEVPFGGCSFMWCHSPATKIKAPILSENAMCSFMQKMKFLKNKIKLWNGTRQSEKNKRRMLQQELGQLDSNIDKGNIPDSILHQRLEVCKSLKEMDKLISMEIAQKAKIKWAVEGDENSKYYHSVLNKKRNQLAIRGVLYDGVWEERPNVVKNEFLNHFRNRFDRPNSIRPILDMDFPNRLSMAQKEDLEAVVSSQEVKKAVWDCGTDKSPRPDGFTFCFYKRFWDLIESDVVAAVKSFFESGTFYKGYNSSFITLIPKILDAKLVKDFRPICLIGSLYKIISKILANRLVLVLGDLVNEVQSAFVADRQILDGPFILNEVYQWCKAKRKQSFVLKIDFEKAYDSVRWDYVGDVLRKFGFGEKWCGWIHECFRTSRGSILVNGSPSIEFQFYKGLKQGDPLAPFLFILVMESLHLSFNRVVDAGMYQGIVLNPSMHLSHLFFVDDVVFMGQWNSKNIDTIIYVLKCFQRASGLCINVSKSKLMGIAVNEDCVLQAANRIGCGILKAPFTYLGSKVGGNMSRICSWDEIVPMKVLHRMETIRSRFFNGVDLNSKKPIWVSWSKVLASKEKGGLGVSSFYALNRALMFKWVWRFKTQKEMLWSRVIKAIHGVNGKIGAYDGWIGDTPLKLLFPRLYVLETNKELSVACKLSQGNPSCSFRRIPRSGVKQSQMEGLVELLESVTLGTSSDRWYWSLDSSGKFSVTSNKKVLDANRLPYVSSQTRWSKEMPIKVNVTAWKVRLDCLPTRLNISRRGLDIPSILCPMCGLAAESTDHVFFRCGMSKDLFPKVCNWWNVEFREIRSYEDWASWITSIRLSIKLKSLLQGSYRVFIGVVIDVKTLLVGLSG